MSLFSSKQAINFSFFTYSKHFVLLVIASAAVTGVLRVYSDGLRGIAQQSGIVHAVDIVAIAKKQGHPATVWSVLGQVVTNLKTVSWYYYARLLLVAFFGYALFFFLILGFMNLCLALKDTGAGSIKLLFSPNFVQAKRFAGAAAFYFLTVFVGCIGAVCAVVPATMLSNFFFSTSIATSIAALVCSCLIGAVIIWVMGYMFVGFCILDNTHIGSLGALQMSATLSKGFRIQIIKTFLLMLLLVMVLLVILVAGILVVSQMFSLADSTSAALVNFISDAVAYPPFFLCSSYIYRALNPKQSA